jgi:SAM-dependent methyltransferase
MNAMSSECSSEATGTIPSFSARGDMMDDSMSEIQYRILKAISSGEENSRAREAYDNKSKLELLLGHEFLKRVPGKTIIDFGCGTGTEAVELAQRGAKRVIGIDVREDVLRVARNKALAASLQGTCQFSSSANELADIIVSIDAFEHFQDPAGVLRIMYALLASAGEIFISFGPTWHHPLGGHLFSVFPWAHLLFSEKALIRWRSDFKTDGATRFSEVEGGLNQMTIAKFKQLIAESHFTIAALELVPIKKLHLFHNRLTCEFTTAIVRCRLIKRA